MQNPSDKIRDDVMALVLNGIITTRKNDRDMVMEARGAVGIDKDFIIDEVINIQGVCCIGGEKEPTPVRGKPDWQNVCLFLLSNADTSAKRKASKMLEDTKLGSKVEIDTLTLSKHATDVRESMREVVEYRPSSPTVNIRCGWSRVTDDAVADSEKVATKTRTVDSAVINPSTHEVG
jgi:hypothetical protein